MLSGAAIIIVTIQTFPFAVTAMADNKALAGKSFAVIADEAHSSQTGNTANKLKEILSPAELADVQDGGVLATDLQVSAAKLSATEAEIQRLLERTGMLPAATPG